jgi:glycosyltransferase involved in cell wall biosynthesis
LVKCLTKFGHIVGVFIPETADETFLPLKDVVDEFKVFPVRKTAAGLIYSTIRYLPPVGYSLADIERTQEKIANVINRSDYEVVFIEQDRYIMSPFFLKFIKTPAVYYCPQPSRIYEEILRKVSQQKKDSANLFVKARRNLWHKYFVSKIPEIDKQNATHARYILTNSYFSREAILRSYGLNSFVSYLGIDTEVFKPLGVSKNNFVLSVGSCIPAKGYDFIVRSLSYIDSKIRPPLVIVSNFVDAHWKTYLEQLSFRNGVKLEVKTLIKDEELIALYNKAKLFVYAPYLEPFGLAPLEAMACGTPVVAVKEGGSEKA